MREDEAVRRKRTAFQKEMGFPSDWELPPGMSEQEYRDWQGRVRKSRADQLAGLTQPSVLVSGGLNANAGNVVMFMRTPRSTPATELP